jgi:hypothetical protein
VRVSRERVWVSKRADSAFEWGKTSLKRSKKRNCRIASFTHLRASFAKDGKRRVGDGIPSEPVAGLLGGSQALVLCLLLCCVVLSVLQHNAAHVSTIDSLDKHAMAPYLNHLRAGCDSRRTNTPYPNMDRTTTNHNTQTPTCRLPPPHQTGSGWPVGAVTRMVGPCISSLSKTTCRASLMRAIDQAIWRTHYKRVYVVQSLSRWERGCGGGISYLGGFPIWRGSDAISHSTVEMQEKKMAEKS